MKSTTYWTQVATAVLKVIPVREPSCIYVVSLYASVKKNLYFYTDGKQGKARESSAELKKNSLAL